MPEFRYRARDERGEAFTGEVEAANYDAAVEQILAMGATPVDLRPADVRRNLADVDLNEILKQYFEPSVKLEDLIMFTRQLQTLMRAGVPIVRSLRGLRENTKNPRLARAVEEVADGLERGQTLSEAMAEQSEVFPRLLIAMVRVGEESGQLEESLGRMAENLDQERQTQRRIKQALRYPTLVMFALAIGLAVVNIFVIPAFADLFKQFDAELPLSTRALIATSDFFVTYWWAIVGTILLVFFGVRSYTRTDEGRLRWDRFKLRIPGVGRIVFFALLSRFARTFSMAVRSGVPLLQALSSVADATDNVYVAEGIRGMRDGIERGEGLHSVAVRSGMFTPLVLQMLSVGEETGQVADMMDQVADFYDREVEADLEQLSAYIEPFVLLIIAGFVLVMAIGIFLPMWQIGSEALG